MNETRPLASILIPVHNAERYIGATIDSALAQTYDHVEIIAIDDGSTDRSAEVLGRYGDRIRWWSQDNAGQAITRNRLLAASSGAYLEFLDADDILHPEKIATQIRALESRPEAGVALGAMRLFYKDVDEETTLFPNPVGIDPWVALITLRYPFTSAGLWTRGFLESMGGWREGIVTGHEYDRYFEVLKRGAPIAFTDEPHTWYRMPSREKPNPRPRMTTLAERRKGLDRIEEYLNEAGMLTSERRRALAEQRLDIARKMWAVDARASAELARSIPRGEIGVTSQTPNLPAHFLLSYKILGFEGAQRLAQLKRGGRA